MIVFFDPPTADRLATIERFEGIPQVELVRQAVDVWSLLDAGERRAIGVAAMQLVVERMRRRT